MIRVLTMPMSDAKRKTAKLLLGIVSETANGSTSGCVIGEKQTGIEPGNSLANGATANLQTLVQRKKQPYGLLKPQRQNACKLSYATKCSLLMAGTSARAAAKPNACFCPSITSTMMGTWSVSLARIVAAAPRFMAGYARTGFLRDTKFCA